MEFSQPAEQNDQQGVGDQEMTFSLENEEKQEAAVADFVEVSSTADAAATPEILMSTEKADAAETAEMLTTVEAADAAATPEMVEALTQAGCAASAEAVLKLLDPENVVEGEEKQVTPKIPGEVVSMPSMESAAEVSEKEKLRAALGQACLGRVKADRTKATDASPERLRFVYKGNIAYCQNGKYDETKVRDGGPSFRLEPLTEEEKIWYCEKLRETSHSASSGELPDAPRHAECETIENSEKCAVTEEKSVRSAQSIDKGEEADSENSASSQKEIIKRLQAEQPPPREKKLVARPAALQMDMNAVSDLRPAAHPDHTVQFESPVAEIVQPKISAHAAASQSEKSSAFVRMLSMFHCGCAGKKQEKSAHSDMQHSPAVLKS